MIELKFNSPYLSITKLATIELNNFSVITGKNGSGKSHLLAAIANGSVSAVSIQTDRIVLFDYDSFRLQDEAVAEREHLQTEKINGWNSYSQVHRNEIELKLREFLTGYYDFFVTLARKIGRAHV